MYPSFRYLMSTRLVLAWLAALLVVPPHATQATIQEPDSLRPVRRLDPDRVRSLLEQRRVEVPGVVGLHVDTATHVLRNARLAVGDIRPTGSAELPGTVLAQRPSEASVVMAGTAVTLVVAAAQGVEIHRLEPAEALPGSEHRIRVYGSGFNRSSQITIRDVRTEPTQFLSTRELLVDVSVPSDAAPGPKTVTHRHIVAVRAPPPPVMLEGGFRVLPLPAQGVRVPPLSGNTVPEAAELLEAERLRPGEIAEVPSEASRGTVVRQDPPPRTIVEPGSSVHLWISRGEEEAAGPPDLMLVEETVEYPEDSRGARITVRVLNEGDSGVGPTIVRAQSETREFEWREEREIEAVPPGGSAPVTFVIPSPAMVTTRVARVRLTVDPDDRVREASEENNAVTVTVEATVASPPPPERDGIPWKTVLLATVGVAAAGGLVWGLQGLRTARARARSAAARDRRQQQWQQQEQQRQRQEREAEPAVTEETAGPAPDDGGSEAERAGREATTFVKDQAEPVRFTAYHPKEVSPDEWNTLLVYVHIPSAADAIAEDSAARLVRERPEYGQRSGAATRTIARGTDITVVPELPGVRFNPERKRFQWLENWHCADFRMLAAHDQPGLALGMPVTGRVAFYVGPVLIGEVGIWTVLADTAAPHRAPEQRSASSDPFRAIFPSYSHRDAEIVAELKRAYVAIGDTFLQDVDVLRSGERWNDKLLEKIDEADVFQLYWSEESRRSTYVEQEWRHALEREVPNFIRPLFWRHPLAGVPSELAALHFAFVELDRPGSR